LANPQFKEVFDLNEYDGVAGHYIIILDEYNQAYFGITSDLRRRMTSHWSKTKEFDRLIFGRVENSILSIDSFRALDTTRIFVSTRQKTHEYEEDALIKSFPKKFTINRTAGGPMYLGLREAITHRKTRDM